MELRGYLQSFRKHWLTVALLVLLGAVGGLAAYRLTPPTYAGTVTFYVSTPLTDGSNPLSAGQFAQARVNSYVSLLQSDDLARRVLADQGLAMSVPDLQREITATAELNTVLVTATVQDASPDRALKISQGIASTFGAMVDQLDNQGRKEQVVVINVVSGPSLDAHPISPSLRRFGGLGLLLGLLAGSSVALLRDLLDNTVRTTETAAALAGAPVLGVIDHDNQFRRQPVIVASSGYSARAESFRQLRTNLQFIGATRRLDVLMVSSSLAGEGKSLTVANLAQSFAEFGDRVLVIEADLRRPRLSTYLGLESEVGLSNVLVGQVDVASVVQQWGAAGLHVLPCGSIPPNPAELLGSLQMSDLIDKLRSEYDKIIIDTPPLLPVADAAICSAVADGVLLVVRWGKTHRSQVTSSIAALRQVNAHLEGTVGNMRKVGRRARRRYVSESYASVGQPVWDL